MKVGVLAGGPSNERAISLRSGAAVYKALREEGYDVKFLDIFDAVYDKIKKAEIDVAFVALHGRFGEDGTVQGILEKLQVPYTGSGVAASRLALDKVASKKVFERNAIPVPKYLIFKKGAYRASDALRLKWPIVVKPQLEGSSIGLSIVKTPAALKKATEKAFKYGDVILLEEYIDGRELTVGILDEKPLPVIEIIPAGGVYDTTAKYKDKRTRYIVPAKLDKKILKKAERLGLATHRSLGCRALSRIDMRMDKEDDLFVLEANSIPGMTERSLLPKAAQVTGLSFNQLCVKLLNIALSDHRDTGRCLN